MHAVADTVVMLALFYLGEGETILILLLVLILFGAKKLPGLGQGLGRGISEFRKASKQVTDEFDEASSDAGRSLGGIYGKPAAQALTTDNQVAELYDPAALKGETRPRKRSRVFKKGFMALWGWISRLVRAIRRVGSR